MKVVKTIKVMILITIILAFYTFPGCGGSSDDPVTNEDTKSLTFTGTGTDITKGFKCLGGLVLFGFVYTGDGVFFVHLVDVVSGEIESYLVSETGNFTGNISDNPTQGGYFLEVESSGDWTITVTGDIE